MSARRLRIAMLSVHSCPLGSLGARDTGGMSVYIRELAVELGKLGHSVDIFTRVHDPNDGQIDELGQNARLIHLKAGDDEEMHKLVLYSYLPDFACNVENFRKLNGLSYDLIFSHYWLSAQVGQELRVWWGVPHIVMFHTLGAVKNSLGIGEEEPELRLETERELIRDCHRVIASTEREKEALLHYYGASPEKIGVVPCGVNRELFQPIDQRLARQELGWRDDRIVLFVGRIDPLKGIDRLLEAVACLPDTRGLRLIIVGGDGQSESEIERLHQLARALGIQDLVTFLGLIKHERMPYFYSAADVCVVPSYYESFGLVALESLACGTPVVTTDVGDLRKIIRPGETGYVVANASPTELADKIALILSRPVRDTTSIQSIRASVARFSWSNIARAIAKECHGVLAGHLATVS
ncbi:MAG: glycosyltransferase [Dehalococcoidales bacterium]|nr:glycosyltransferase [Dehalococcoidales bacterium]